jgi:hypothetical protein
MRKACVVVRAERLRTSLTLVQHPMKPHRIKLCHSLIMNYGLYVAGRFRDRWLKACRYKRMEIFVRASCSSHPTIWTPHTARQTGDTKGDGAIPHGRIRRLPRPHLAREHGLVRPRASQVCVRLRAPMPLALWTSAQSTSATTAPSSMASSNTAPSPPADLWVRWSTSPPTTL